MTPVGAGRVVRSRSRVVAGVKEMVSTTDEDDLITAVNSISTVNLRSPTAVMAATALQTALDHLDDSRGYIMLFVDLPPADQPSATLFASLADKDNMV